MTLKFQPIKFPRDGQVHNNYIEWWYFNGHLSDASGNRYSFMDCLFKADVKKVKIPFLQKLPFKDVYFAHSILSDIAKQKSWPQIKPIAAISQDSFSKKLLFVNYTDPLVVNNYFNSELIETEPFVYKIKTENFCLNLHSRKPPLLEGGKGFIKVTDKYSYYYSLTNLATEGEIKIGNQWIKVKGKSWMDHQWADTSYTQDKWTWFAVQLANNVEVVCVQYGADNNYDRFATIMYADGRQKHTTKVEIRPLMENWISHKTKARYQLGWQINLPEFELSFTTEPLIKRQEIIFGTINYWEGPLKISAEFRGRKVSGQGFLELVGYPSHYGNLQFVRSEFKGAAKKLLKVSQKEIGKMIRLPWKK